jgi:hypothetical protein
VDTNRIRRRRRGGGGEGGGEGEDLWRRCCLTLNKFRFTIVVLMYPTSITMLYEERKCYELMDKH